ncbi:MAG: hypothetical protein Kow0069_28240 [Promethearchaeota archaeon]
MRWLVLIMRGLIVLAFASLFSLLIRLFNPDFVALENFTALFSFATNLKDSISYVMFLLFSMMPFLLSYLFAALFYASFFYFNPYFFMGVFSVLSQGIIASWFSFSGARPLLRFSFGGGGPKINAQDLSNLFAGLSSSASSMTQDLYYLMFQIFLFLSLLNGIRLIFSCKSKHALKSMFFFILMIVVPLSVQGLINLLSLFNVNPTFLTSLPNPLTPIVQESFETQIRYYLASVNFLIPLAVYGFVELSYQLEYVDLVTKPSVERATRLKAQVQVIQEQAKAGMAYIERVQEEIKEEKKKLGKVQESARQFLSQSTGGFSGVKEMIEKHRLEREEREWLEAAHDTRRLGTYVNRLFVEDPEAKDALTAASSAPEPFRLAWSTFISLVTRSVFVAVLVVYTIHPQFLFEEVFRSPPAITESVEMLTPEVVLAALIPIILLFPVVGAGVRAVYQERLRRRLEAEGTLEALLASIKAEERERWGILKERKKKKKKKEEKEIFISEGVASWRKKEEEEGKTKKKKKKREEKED